MSETAIVALVGFLAIITFIVFLYVRRNRSERKITDLYRQYSLASVTNPPVEVHQALGAGWRCFQGNLPVADRTVPFHWWTKYMRATGSGIDHFLAISFLPDTVSEAFKQYVLEFADQKRVSILEKIKDSFVLNLTRPIRVEKLSDGSFLMVWQVYKDPKYYEAKIIWLINHVTV